MGEFFTHLFWYFIAALVLLAFLDVVTSRRWQDAMPWLFRYAVAGAAAFAALEWYRAAS